MAYLKAQAEALGGLETTVLTYVPNKPVLVIKWAGREPELPAVLFNSHYDVVPAVEALWRTPPFEPTMTDDGKIIARGTQDMKCVCMQYLEALGQWRRRHPAVPRLPPAPTDGAGCVRRQTLTLAAAGPSVRWRPCRCGRAPGVPLPPHGVPVVHA